MAQQIQVRKDTTAGWTASNPILAQGEFGIDITTSQFKIGDGTTDWLGLTYHKKVVTDINLIKAGLWNYPSNNGVVIQTAQHNESIAIKSNQSAALRWHIRDDGSFVGSDHLVILSHNQSLSDGSAVGFNITEREVAPVTGHYYYVNLESGDAQFNGQYLCVASTTTTIVFDYVNDVSAYDTTGITGTIDFPSIYNQVEARETGVWIKNANWTDQGSNAYSHYWNFKTTGAIQFPNLPSNVRTGSGEVLQFGNSGSQSIITGPPTSGTAQRLVVAGQDGGTGTAGEGGDIYLWAGRGGDAGGSGGDIKLDGGNASGTAEGGTVKMRGGNTDNGTGGFIQILAGNTGTGTGGPIDITAGSVYAGEGTFGGNVNITSGYSNYYGNGGDISISTQAGGSVTIDGAGGINLNTSTGAYINAEPIATHNYVATAKSTYSQLNVYYSDLNSDLSHVGSLLYACVAGDTPANYHLTTEASVNFPIGSEIKFATNGASPWLISAVDTATTTLIGEGSNGYTAVNYTFIVPTNSTATLLKVDTERWILSSLRLTD